MCDECPVRKVSGYIYRDKLSDFNCVLKAKTNGELIGRIEYMLITLELRAELERKEKYLEAVYGWYIWRRLVLIVVCTRSVS